MTKKELVVTVAEKTRLSKKDVELTLKVLTETISEEMSKGGKVQLVGFGTFEVGSRNERKWKNPKTGEDIVSPACKVPKFKAGRSLKDLVNA